MKNSLRLALCSIFLAFAFPFALEAACSGSSPNLVAPTWADVAACHTAATSGDTITVTAGTYTVTANTAISKYVKILAGGVVNLTDNVCAGSCAATDLISITEATAGSIVFSGFTITQGTSIHEAPAAVIRVSPFSSPSDTGKPVIIANHIYNPIANGDFIHMATNKGLVTGNYLDASALIHTSGSNCRAGVVGFVRHKLAFANPAWSTPSTFGALDTDGEHAVYIENNTLINDVENPLDSDDYARTVFRFNNTTNSGLATHGNDTSGTGNRYAEIYFNDFIYDGSPQPNCHLFGQDAPLDVTGFMGLRGGTNMIIGNRIDDIDSGPWWGNKSEIIMYEEKINRNAGPYPCWDTTTAMGAGPPSPHQTGWGYTVGAIQPDSTGIFQDLQPIYYAANTGGGNYGTPGVAGYSPNECGMSAPSASSYIIENQEFFKQIALGSFTGTSGASQGTRAQRPASTTNGVGFWATNAGGNWNTINGTSDDGCLDVVVSGSWVNCFYTPYNYPHPLSLGPVPPTPSLVFTTNPVNTHTGATMASFVVKAYLSGSVDTTFSGDVTIALTSACGTTMSGTLTVAASSGVATFSSAVGTGSGPSCTLTATASGATSGVSGAFSIGPNQVGVTVQPDTTYASGAAVPFTVAGQFFTNQATDPLANNSVSLSITALSGVCNLAGITSGALSSGVRAFSPTVTGSGNCFITAASSGLTSGATNSFDITVPANTPTLTSLSPASGQRGKIYPVILIGTNLTGGVLHITGSGVTISNVVIVDSTRITATFTIAAKANLSPRGVTVQTPGGTSNSKTFAVTNVKTVRQTARAPR